MVGLDTYDIDLNMPSPLYAEPFWGGYYGAEPSIRVYQVDNSPLLSDYEIEDQCLDGVDYASCGSCSVYFDILPDSSSIFALWSTVEVE